MIGIIRGLWNFNIVGPIILALLLVWNLFLYICLCSIIINGARVLHSSCNRKEKESTTESLANIVKCLMTKGVFYDSTTSSEPLYVGEEPTLAFKPSYKNEIEDFCKLLRKNGNEKWACAVEKQMNKRQETKE